MVQNHNQTFCPIHPKTTDRDSGKSDVQINCRGPENQEATKSRSSVEAVADAETKGSAGTHRCNRAAQVIKNGRKKVNEWKCKLTQDIKQDFKTKQEREK